MVGEERKDGNDGSSTLIARTDGEAVRSEIPGLSKVKVEGIGVTSDSVVGDTDVVDSADILIILDNRERAEGDSTKGVEGTSEVTIGVVPDEGEEIPLSLIVRMEGASCRTATDDGEERGPSLGPLTEGVNSRTATDEGVEGTCSLTARSEGTSLTAGPEVGVDGAASLTGASGVGTCITDGEVGVDSAGSLTEDSGATGSSDNNSSSDTGNGISASSITLGIVGTSEGA